MREVGEGAQDVEGVGICLAACARWRGGLDGAGGVVGTRFCACDCGVDAGDLCACATEEGDLACGDVGEEEVGAEWRLYQAGFWGDEEFLVRRRDGEGGGDGGGEVGDGGGGGEGEGMCCVVVFERDGESVV